MKLFRAGVLFGLVFGAAVDLIALSSCTSREAAGWGFLTFGICAVVGAFFQYLDPSGTIE